MSREIDEDLIEATIRKVAEQAAREGNEPEPGAPPAPSKDEAPPARQPVDEDLIEATVRRVSGQNTGAPDPSAEDEAPPARQPVDEDLIEATIRRVAAQKAAKLAGDPDWEHAQAPPLEPPVEPEPEEQVEDEPLVKAPAPSVRAFAGAEWEHRALTAHSDDVVDEPEAASELDEVALSRDDWQAGAASAMAARSRQARQPDVEDAIERIEQTLVALIERVDAIVPVIEQLAGAAEADWPAGPAFPRIGATAALRSVLRDPSPRTATAEHLEPDVIDTRPIPKPLPPIEPKRSLDLLPRTYRITVEDKRRGVDLVPLHRALLSIDGVRDMSLLSYNNGIAMVSLEATTDIEPEVVRQSVSRAMAREARIETNNEQAMVVKLAED